MDVTPFLFFPMGPAFSGGLLKFEDTFYSKCDDTLSNEVATEAFGINGINCQFFLGKKER